MSKLEWIHESTRYSEQAPIAPASDAANRCQALNKKRQQCGTAAQRGELFCGNHLAAHSGANMPCANVLRRCQGTTLKQQPCRAAAQRGHDYCPQHQHQATAEPQAGRPLVQQAPAPPTVGRTAVVQLSPKGRTMIVDDPF